MREDLHDADATDAADIVRVGAGVCQVLAV